MTQQPQTSETWEERARKIYEEVQSLRDNPTNQLWQYKQKMEAFIPEERKRAQEEVLQKLYKLSRTEKRGMSPVDLQILGSSLGITLKD